MIKITTLLFGIILLWNNSYSQIRINEVCSSNKGNLYDEKLNTPDWIELYNYSDESVNLKNWKISDQSEFDSAWQLPDTLIEPGGYFLICASDGSNNKVRSFNVISNGVKNTHFNFEDQLSWTQIKVKGDFKFEVKYNSFKSTLNPIKDLSLGGILIKEKLLPKSKMIGFFNYPNEGRQAFIHLRQEEEVYRGVDHVSDRIKIDENEYVVERKADSIYFKICDENGNVLKKLSYFIQMMNEIHLGFTVITHDINDYDTLSIKRIKLNGNELNFNAFSSISYFDTNIDTEEIEYSHSDFKLSSLGDSLFLFENGSIKQEIEVPELLNDISYSYLGNKKVYFKEATPGYENSLGYSKINKISEDLDQIFFINGNKNFENIDSTYRYTNDLSVPNKTSNRLIDYNSDTSNYLLVQRIDDENIDSELLQIPIFEQEKIINNLIHFHLFTDTSYLYNNYTGIINQTFSYSKVRSFLAITKNNTNIYKGQIELRKHGNFSNIWRKQTPFRLIFDSDYNFENEELFFPIRKKIFGSALVLRNGGDDEKTMLRSRFAYSTISNTNLLAKDYNTAILNLNNRFWGVYNLRERMDDDFLADYYKVQKNQINSFENDLRLKYGSPLEMIELNKYLNENKSNNNFEVIDSILDIKNFIDYIFIHTFNIQHDWPHNNVVAYSAGNKWKYLVTDLDYSYKYRGAGADINFIDQIFRMNENITTRILFALLKSKTFTNDYINRSCDLMNTTFSADSLVTNYDSLANYFSQFRELQNMRWPNTLNNWEEDTKEVRTFIYDRPSFYFKHLQFFFEKKPALLNLTSFPNTAGGFKVNTLTIDEPEWSGKYLQEVPVTITAVPKKGYKFKKWNIDSLGSNAKIIITLPDTMNLQAIYEEVKPSDNSINIVINEIMYNADKDKDTKDWIELYNAGKEEVNLNGWSLIDEDDTHTPFVINEDYTIQPDEYVILTKSKTDFESIVDIENKIFGDFDFGFGGNDLVKLLDADGDMHDTVNYDNDLPWPEGADGTGYTIELIHPGLDNSLAENWELSKPELGTAGFVNSVYDDTKVSVASINSNSQLNINFIDKQLNIQSENEITGISLYDMSGKKIYLDYNINYNIVKSSLKNIPNGLYLLNIQLVDGQEETVKLIID